ncbi:MAG: NADP-dependent malic enzyme [bacterium]|jgi:malate dehydrogenase (oxaloacetate-decarboxylating)(NADP+)|nr:NADP-dependent malic enzyme [bacterium]
MITREEALEYHSRERKGKLESVPCKPCTTARDLSMAYTPGVAEPCREIHKNPSDAYEYTNKGNLVAVLSNGTAVLGLGNLGALAGKPVMEGKGVLFKRFADVDVYDIEVDTMDPEKIIQTAQLISPTFGGINLEDIKAPECFEIEERLIEMLDIPVFHDDQHGTAIISAAALLNAVELAGKKMDEIKIVVNGAGASGISCSKLYVRLGAKLENITMCDTNGVIYKGRDKLNKYKEIFAKETALRTLDEAFAGADVAVGLSAKGAFSQDMIRSMAPNPIVFAMANPDPEIMPAEAKAVRDDIIMATGRSDFPNQVNNVLGFPFIFRGALDVRASRINEEMKVAASLALAELARQDVPESVFRAYGNVPFAFGPEYIIPKPFDQRVLLYVAPAVARAAIDTGVARIRIDDPEAWIEAYRRTLQKRLGRHMAIMGGVLDRARLSPKRIVFPEGEYDKVLMAAKQLVADGIAHPILVGRQDIITTWAGEHDLDLGKVTVIHPGRHEKHQELVEALHQLRARRGITLSEADSQLRRDPVTLGAMLVRQGLADGMVSGADMHYPDSLRPVMQLLYGKEANAPRAAGIYLLFVGSRVLFVADTTVKVKPTAHDLAEYAVGTARLARQFGYEPRVALLNHSNFGSTTDEGAQRVRQAVELLHARGVDFQVDGDMQADTALSAELLTGRYNFNRLDDEANVLIFPDMTSANIAYKLLIKAAGAVAVGPILIGNEYPVNILQRGADVAEIVNLTAVTVVDARARSDR